MSVQESSSSSSSNNNNNERQSKCPVDYGRRQPNGVHEPDDSSSSFWSRLWRGSDNGISSDNNTKNPNNTMPASLEEAARHAQTPQPDQTIPLNTSRQVSSIPRGTSSSDTADAVPLLPAHQNNNHSADHNNDNANNWIYPSEQQLYNAMRRKGWQNIPEASIPVVLQIHNNINERCWRQIQEWEGADTDNNSIELARFQGRPRDLSPKAFFWSKILRLYEAPFDRHDWYVAVQQNSNKSSQTTTTTTTEPILQRYVIDYYYLPPSNNNLPPIPYVDARPALDHPRAIWLRGRKFLREALPGITSYYDSYNTKAAASVNNNNASGTTSKHSAQPERRHGS